MSLTPVNSNNSNPANLNQTNNAIRQLNKETQTKVFKGPNNVNALINGKLPNDLGYGVQLADSNGVPRIIAYIDANNNPIFKVSGSDVDVTTATNDELIFNSGQNVFKIVASGSVTVPAPAMGTNESSEVSVDTGIVSSVPLAMTAYIDGDDAIGYTALPYVYPAYDAAGAYGGLFWIYRCFTEVVGGEIRVNIRCNNYDAVGTPGARVVKYYVLQESAA